MNNICFYTWASDVFLSMAQDLERSVKKFYPDIPFYIYKINGNDTFPYKGKIYEYIKEVLDKHKNTVHINADSVMCSECPELFSDIDFALPRNNVPNTILPHEYYYLNNGLFVINNKDILREIIEQTSLFVDGTVSPGLSDQNVYNRIFYSGKYKTQVLSYPDKSYGIEELDQYPNVYLKDKDIYAGDKKVCILHFAGEEWKNYEKGVMNYDRLLNKDVRERIKELIS
jgi:hypothetical protein